MHGPPTLIKRIAAFVQRFYAIATHNFCLRSSPGTGWNSVKAAWFLPRMLLRRCTDRGIMPHQRRWQCVKYVFVFVARTDFDGQKIIITFDMFVRDREKTVFQYLTGGRLVWLSVGRVESQRSHVFSNALPTCRKGQKNNKKK